MSAAFSRTRSVSIAAALVAVVLAVAAVSLAIGSVSLRWEEWWRGLMGPSGDPLRIVVWEVRLPRVVLGLAVGGVLGLCGAAMQGYLKNPLADPGILGVSSGAALGAVVVFYTGWSASWAWALPLGGLVGGLGAALMLLALAGRDASAQTLILAGLALNALFGALTALALNLSPNPFANMEVMFWLMGSLTDRGWSHVGLALPLMAAGSACLLLAGPALRALSLGEDTAASLGFRAGRTRWLLVGGCAMAVGASVAIAGAIGFVGLVVPHVLRPLAKSDPQRLLWMSALGGAVLLPVADIVVRLVRIGPELRLGVVTALVGAPFFLALLWRWRRQLP